MCIRDRNHTALRGSAQCLVVFPVLQVPGFQHLFDEPQEPVVVDLLRQDPDHYFMVKGPEAVGDVTLDASMNHLVPVQVRSTSRSAVWQPLLGRNPCEWSENVGS